MPTFDSTSPSRESIASVISSPKRLIKVSFEIRDNKKIIPNRKTIKISVNGTTLIRVLPTKQVEEILILENKNNECKKHLVKKGMELPIISSPEKLDEFGICYDTELSEIRIFGENGTEVKMPTSPDWVLKFKCQGSWMNNQIWLNPSFK